jgi:predicted aspartyl protease
MSGEVSADGEPIVRLQVAGTNWIGVIDTGFNGHLDLPLALKPHVNAVFYADQDSILADGSIIKDAIYEFDFPFDGHMVRVYASFSPVTENLIGTALLADYRLEIDFPADTVELTRLQGP